MKTKRIRNNILGGKMIADHTPVWDGILVDPCPPVLMPLEWVVGMVISLYNKQKPAKSRCKLKNQVRNRKC